MRRRFERRQIRWIPWLPGLAFAAALGAAWLSLREPLFDAPYSTILLARDGQLLGARIARDGQWRFPSQGPVPEKFAAALIAYEDKRFHEHFGVDPLALARAVRLDLLRRRVVSGGSTITMQVARLSRGRADRGLKDKLAEMALALGIELVHDKREILALYAAHAPFGGNVVGLDAAAWRYFGRTAQQLSWAEACTLAVLPNSPALVHPGRNRARLLEKRNRLLRRLHEQGRLGELDLSLALHEPLAQERVPLPQHAPHLLETLRSQAPGIPRFETTLDANLQAAATAVVRARAEELAREGIHNAAALIIDNRTFEVLAYVGNAQWSVDNEHGFAVDIVQRPRSTGSILKPFLYAAMLESGDILPHTLIPDVPTQYSGYMPENFDRSYSGAVPADIALARSRNVPAVRMLQQYGVGRFHALLTKAGISTLYRAPDEYGLTLILGGAEGKLWDISTAYANLANIAAQARAGPGPVYRKARVLRGAPPANEPAASRAEIGPASAWLTLNALLEVARPGEEAHWRSFASSRKIAWKTGTSWGLRDAWAVGSSARYTVGVWVGNASGEGRPGLTGSVAAAPLLFQLFNLLDPGAWLPRPDADMKPVEVCANDGYLSNGYCETRTVQVPRSSHFARTSPYNVPVHLDASGRYRVTGACESVLRMTQSNAFVLPPGQEFYFRRRHPEYRGAPPFRSDCDPRGVSSGKRPLDFLYPNAGTRVYIPTDLGAKKGRVVFEAVHRDPDAVLHWHLDETYVASTRTFHTEALDIAPGSHVITVVDGAGNRLSRRFEVIGARQARR